MSGFFHLVRVVIVVVLLLGAVYYATGTLRDFRREDALDFAALGPEDLVVDFALTRRQIGLLTFGYVEASGFRPQVGLFGNHQAQLLSSEAFGEAKDSGFFFNNWYANLGLPELRDQLYYFKVEGLLPEQLVLIHITTPNNDNGAHIIEYGSELPVDVRQLAARALGDSNVRSGSSLVARLRWRLSYANFLLALRGPSRYWVLEPGDCAAGAASQDERVCRRQSWSITRDGAAHPKRVSSVRGEAVRNENPLDETKSHLTYGDEEVIATYMRQIVEIGADTGVPFVFVILPVYETPDRSDSMVNRIMDDALRRLDDVEIIDHRRRYLDAAYFDHYDHPNLRYYRELLVPEICERYRIGC